MNIFLWAVFVVGFGAVSAVMLVAVAGLMGVIGDRWERKHG